MTMTEVTAVTQDDDQDDELTSVYVELFRLQDENARLRTYVRELLGA